MLKSAEEIFGFSLKMAIDENGYEEIAGHGLYGAGLVQNFTTFVQCYSLLETVRLINSH